MDKTTQGEPIDFNAVVKEFEAHHLRWAIDAADGNRVKAARLLGLTYRSFRHYARKHNMPKAVGEAYAARNAQKSRATLLLNAAVNAGKILRPAACTQCGSDGRIEGHHRDYSKPLDVIWLCLPCHNLEHMKQRQAQRAAAHLK